MNYQLLGNTRRHTDDVRNKSKNPFSPNFYIDFLNLASVKQAIGAIPTFADCSDTPLSTDAGDDARTWLP